ncbi:MAG: hypothetical protein Harvfovirus80_3 [Harvfovirus sp.]|uniref:BTB domain-containing protein n=1 Tax=Harvfovirus sp. TaxID=2487768 RepID=A0A3G5A3Z2_9VIRU|nr:MAG: hypothetical protein Harvfovirus80_3 [Harvfovirus sp.]
MTEPSAEATLHILANNQTFTVLMKTINKFKDSILSKVVNGADSDFISREAINKISVDMDHDSLKFIINYMRGYPYANIEEPLLSKVFFDANRLGLASLVTNIKLQIADSATKEDTIAPVAPPQLSPQQQYQQFQQQHILKPINVNDLAKNVPPPPPQQTPEQLYVQQEYAQQQYIQQHAQQQKQFHTPQQNNLQNFYHNGQNTQTSNNPENFRNLQNANHTNQMNRAYTDVQWHDQHDTYDDYAHDQFGSHHRCANHSYTR